MPVPTQLIGLGSSGLRMVELFHLDLLSNYTSEQVDTFFQEGILTYIILETDRSAKKRSFLPQNVFLDLGDDAATFGELRRKLGEDALNWVYDIQDGVQIDTSQGAANARQHGEIALWQALRRLQNRIRKNIPQGDFLYTFVVGSLEGGTCAGAFISLGYYLCQKLIHDNPFLGPQQRIVLKGLFTLTPGIPGDDVSGRLYAVFQEFNEVSYGRGYIKHLPYELGTLSFSKITGNQREPYDETYFLVPLPNQNREQLYEGIGACLLLNFMGYSSQIGASHANLSQNYSHNPDRMKYRNLFMCNIGGKAYPDALLLEMAVYQKIIQECEYTLEKNNFNINGVSHSLDEARDNGRQYFRQQFIPTYIEIIYNQKIAEGKSIASYVENEMLYQDDPMALQKTFAEIVNSINFNAGDYRHYMLESVINYINRYYMANHYLEYAVYFVDGFLKEWDAHLDHWNTHFKTRTQDSWQQSLLRWPAGLFLFLKEEKRREILNYAICQCALSKLMQVPDQELGEQLDLENIRSSVQQILDEARVRLQHYESALQKEDAFITKLDRNGDQLTDVRLYREIEKRLSELSKVLRNDRLTAVSEHSLRQMIDVYQRRNRESG